MKILFNLPAIYATIPSLLAHAQSFGLIFFITLIFASIHLFSHHFHRLIKGSEAVFTSFSGGLAIAYVFLHLLPELEQAGTVFGKPIYIITLLGFIIFYGVQSLVWQNSISQKSLESRIFYIEILFLCIYNALIIYTLPEHLSAVASEIILYLVAMGLHLLVRNHGLQKKHNQRFHKIGSYALVCSLFIGCMMEVFLDSLLNNLISDMLTAILAGFILFNVFVEELPSPKKSTFLWFLVGIASYIILLSSEV